MAGVLLGLGALLALVAAATGKAKAAELVPVPSPVGPALKKIKASGNPKAMAAAAVALHKAGHTALAQDVAKSAQSAAVTHPAATYKSPLPNVAVAAWTQFVRAMRGKDAKAITPSYSLGLFGFGMRRLVDLGLASNPHRIERNGRKVWDADWKDEYSPGPDKFLDDPELQYKTFSKSMLAYAKQVARELRELVGSQLDGQQVTLSGLLAVAHQAGFDGLKKWAASPEVRAQFPGTSTQFHKLNGIF